MFMMGHNMALSKKEKLMCQRRTRKRLPGSCSSTNTNVYCIQATLICRIKCSHWKPLDPIVSLDRSHLTFSKNQKLMCQRRIPKRLPGSRSSTNTNVSCIQATLICRIKCSHWKPLDPMVSLDRSHLSFSKKQKLMCQRRIRKRLPGSRSSTNTNVYCIQATVICRIKCSHWKTVDPIISLDRSHLTFSGKEKLMSHRRTRKRLPGSRSSTNTNVYCIQATVICRIKCSHWKTLDPIVSLDWSHLTFSEKEKLMSQRRTTKRLPGSRSSTDTNVYCIQATVICRIKCSHWKPLDPMVSVDRSHLTFSEKEKLMSHRRTRKRLPGSRSSTNTHVYCIQATLICRIKCSHWKTLDPIVSLDRSHLTFSEKEKLMSHRRTRKRLPGSRSSTNTNVYCKQATLICRIKCSHWKIMDPIVSLDRSHLTFSEKEKLMSHRGTRKRLPGSRSNTNTNVYCIQATVICRIKCSHWKTLDPIVSLERSHLTFSKKEKLMSQRRTTKRLPGSRSSTNTHVYCIQATLICRIKCSHWKPLDPMVSVDRSHLSFSGKQKLMCQRRTRKRLPGSPSSTNTNVYCIHVNHSRLPPTLELFQSLLFYSRIIVAAARLSLSFSIILAVKVVH
jgi:Co/Zn/Cd efflux system component